MWRANRVLPVPGSPSTRITVRSRFAKRRASSRVRINDVLFVGSTSFTPTSGLRPRLEPDCSAPSNPLPRMSPLTLKVWFRIMPAFFTASIATLYRTSQDMIRCNSRKRRSGCSQSRQKLRAQTTPILAHTQFKKASQYLSYGRLIAPSGTNTNRATFAVFK